MDSRPAPLLLRLTLAVLGSYGLTTGVVALGTVALASVMPRAEAFTLAGMLGLLLYLAALLWCFAEPRLARLAAVLLGGGGLCFAAAWLLAPAANL